MKARQSWGLAIGCWVSIAFLPSYLNILRLFAGKAPNKPNVSCNQVKVCVKVVRFGCCLRDACYESGIPRNIFRGTSLEQLFIPNRPLALTDVEVQPHE